MNLLLINLVIFLAAGVGCLIVGGIVLNNPPLHDAPGFGKRLHTYLTTHVAETQRQHAFPELELRCYPLAPGALHTRLEHAATLLGWELTDSDPQQHRLHIVVSTALLKFKDDIEITLTPAACGTELHIRSSSRVGRGDLAANTRHILDLYAILARQT